MARAAWFVCLCTLAARSHAADESAPPAPVECRRVTGEIKIDGRDDEDAWKGAQTIDKFAPYWLDGRR